MPQPAPLRSQLHKRHPRQQKVKEERPGGQVQGVRGMGEWLEVRRELCDKFTKLFTPRGFLVCSPLCRVSLRDVERVGESAGKSLTSLPFS